jgi:hypothetical protein
LGIASGRESTAKAAARGSRFRRFLASARSRASYRTLRRLHETLRPETYLEIGIRKGDSLALATTAAVAIGIDPQPILARPAADNAGIFAMTSDDFFAMCDLSAELGGRDLDLAFIDGMHLFEFVLRDFANVEACATPDTVVILHDCLPVDAVSAERERSTSLWTGDVWKVVPVLRRYRPDLHLTLVDAPPSGLVIVEGLDPTSTVLRENMARIVDEFTEADITVFDEHRGEILGIMQDPETVLARLAARRRG